MIKFIVNFEVLNTHTEYYINISQKMSLALFINTAIVTCAIYIFYTHNIYGPGGLIYIIFYFFVVNAISMPLLNILDIDYIWKLIKIEYY